MTKAVRRRAVLAGAASASASPALALFPRGGASVPSGNTLTVAANPAQALTTGVTGVFRATQIVLGWAGAAPSGVTGTWSGGGGVATISGFSVSGAFVSFYASNPTIAGTRDLIITGVGPNTSTATATGIVVSTAVSDIPTGISGPANVMLGQGSFGVNITDGIATYAARGLAGPVRWSLSNVTAGENFTINNLTGVVGTPQTASTASTLTYTVNATDGVTSLTPLVVTVQNPINTVPIATISNTLVLDNAPTSAIWTAHYGTSVAIVANFQLWDGAASLTMSDPSGFFLFTYPVLVIRTTNLTNYGTVNLSMTPAGGSVFVYPITIAHEAGPTLAWVPSGQLTSATPPTNGYGSNQIGTLTASSDSGASQFTDPNSNFNIYSYDVTFSRTGFAYLLNSVSAGTLSGMCQVTSFQGTTSSMVFNLPVANGITAPGSDIAITPVTGLTNYDFPTCVAIPGAPTSPDVSLASLSISGTTLTFASAAGTLAKGMMLYSFYTIPGTVITGGSGLSWTVNLSQTTAGPTSGTAKMPKKVADVSVSGLPFVPNWDLSIIDAIGDNCQLPLWAPLTPQPAAPLFYLPRYALHKVTTTTAIITAWNGSALPDMSPQTDNLVLTITDGNGNFASKSFSNTVSWHTYTGAALSVGPIGSGATWTSSVAMQTALWAAPATYAGASITVLDGVDSVWNYNPYGGSSYAGWWPCPLHFKRDDSTQASFTGTISSVTGTGIYATGTLTATGVTGAINVNDFILIAGVAAGIIPTSGSGSTWAVRGPGVVAMSSVAMTTQHQQFYIDMAGNSSAGNHQGGLACGGGWDIIWEGAEVGFTSNGSSANAGAIYKFNQQAGNAGLINCYLHDSDMGWEGGDLSNILYLVDCLFAGCGPGRAGNSHNIYVDPVASLVMTGCVTADSWAHEFKGRAMNATISGNFFLEGCNWLGSDSLFQNAQGGTWVVTNNVFLKGCNDNVANNGNIIEMYNECAGIGAAEPAWAENSFTAGNNTIVSTVPPGVGSPYQPAVGFNQVVANKDPVRGIAFGYSITNNGFYGISSGQWSKGTFGAADPPIGAGNTSLVGFPFTGTDFINPLTKAQPIRPPLRRLIMASTPGPSSTVTPYATVMRVPSGSSSGTDVVGGMISGYDINSVQMTAISASVTVDGAEFSISVSTPTAQLKTAASLMDGIYFPQVTLTGTGTAPLPTPGYFPVVVGTG